LEVSGLGSRVSRLLSEVRRLAVWAVESPIDGTALPKIIYCV